MGPELEHEVDRYLRTGEHDDLLFSRWPGDGLEARARGGRETLVDALVGEVRRRTGDAQEYFAGSGRFEDFVVHEAAHVFHNCKRRTIGLPHTRRREWLLEIAFAKRETFAYACEAYSRILELGKSPAERRALLSELEREPAPGAQPLGPGEYVDILHEAVAARNGWKRILARCAPGRTARRRGSAGNAV